METTNESTNPTWMNEDADKPGKTDAFKVISILSMIVSGFYILSSIMGLINKFTGKAEADLVKAEEAYEKMSPELAESMMISAKSAVENAIPLNSINLICALLSFTGVYMMWTWKKKGLPIYIAGELISYAGLMFGTMDMFKSMEQITRVNLGSVTIFSMLVFDALFIYFFYTHYKNMNEE